MEHYIKQAISPDEELINFGIYQDRTTTLSYVQISLAIALFINSRALDFVVTGCSSGQGMMLAGNTFPNIQCGYIPTPQDAYLFSHINDGNVVSFPLGLNWGWSGEINFSETMTALFTKPWDKGYPTGEAKRKIKNTKEVKDLNQLTKKAMISFLPDLNPELLIPVLNYDPVFDFIVKNGTDHELIDTLRKIESEYSK